MTLLKVENLSVTYPSKQGPVRAVRDVAIELAAGEVLALVGETGSGKSTVALAVMGLLPEEASWNGTILFDGMRISPSDGSAWQEIRGKHIGMVFQDARGSLNPVMTIGAQLSEALQVHRRLDRRTGRRLAAGLLEEAGLPEPASCMRRYPLELSGGMCQRAAIAIALCNQPELLVADEPTSALDPNIQAQILDLLRRFKEARGLALLLVSHDLALVSEIADRVAVMVHGCIVESGQARDVLRHPAHPYTVALISCIPGIHHRWGERPLEPIPIAPSPGGSEIPGCFFAPRCPRAEPACSLQAPPHAAVSDGHWALCFRPGGDPP